MDRTAQLSTAGLMTARRTIPELGVRRQTLPEAGRKENCRAGFLRGSVMLVERKCLSEMILQKGNLRTSSTTSFSSLHPSHLLLGHLLGKPTRNQGLKGGHWSSQQGAEWKTERVHLKASKRCPAQTLHVKPICVLETWRNEVVSTLEEAIVNREFEEE